MEGLTRVWLWVLGVCLAFLLVGSSWIGKIISPQDTLEIQFPGLLLDMLPQWERVEQMRDWVVYGFLTSQ